MKLEITIITLFVLVGTIGACPDEGHDYLGFKDCGRNVDTWNECATFCSNHDPCYYWTWNKDTTACCTMLKKNFKGKTANENTVSGTWACKE